MELFVDKNKKIKNKIVVNINKMSAKNIRSSCFKIDL